MSVSSRKISLNIFALKGITLLFNLLTVSVSAKYFGLSIDRDIWVIATAFIVNINNTFFNPVTDVFRIKYIQVKEEESQHSALVKTGSLIIFYLLIITLILLGYFFYGKYILNKLFDLEIHMLDVYYQFINILIYSVIFTQITSIGIGILNANNIFYIPETTAFVTAACNLGIIYFTASYIGIYSLYIGQYFNVVVLFICILYFLKKNKLLPIITIQSFYLKKAWVFITFGLPFYFPYIVGQINSLAEKVLSNKMGIGVISMIDYAQKFTSLFQVVFTSIILTSIIPQLTRSFSRRENDVYYNSFFNYLKFIFFILSIFVPILYITSYEINFIFFKRGDVSVENIFEITYLTKLYSISFISVCLYIYISPVMISQIKNKQQAGLGVLTQLVIIGFNCFFYKIFKQSVFAISLGLFHLIVVLVMLFAISIKNKKIIYLYIFRSILILILLVVVAEIIGPLFTLKNAYLSVLCKGGIMLMIVLSVSIFFGINLLSYLKRVLKKWKLKI